MRSDLARMQTLVPSSEKDRLTAHARVHPELEASIRQTLRQHDEHLRLHQAGDAAELRRHQHRHAEASGSVYTTLSGVDYYVNGMPTRHPHLDLGQNQLRLIKTAFACDLVRVATFMWSAGTNWVVFPGTFQGATIKGNLQSTPHHPPSHSDPISDTMTRDWLNQINLFYSQATSTVLQEFATSRTSTATC